MGGFLNVFGFIVWFGLWFVICRIICGNKFLVDRLIISLRKVSKKLSQVKEENEELNKQNKFLKEQIKVLQKKINYLNEAAGNCEDAIVRFKKLSDYVFEMVEIIKDYDYNFYFRFKEFLKKELETEDSKEKRIW